MTREPELPFVDEHSIEIDANRDAVWSSLLEVVDGSFTHQQGRVLACVLGCRERERAGSLDEPGSTMPGFRVATSIPGEELTLDGRHRFSTYALTFRLSAGRSNRVRVRAETRAVFPGLTGRFYRVLVIGTGGHVLIVRRMLRAVQRRAEPPS